MMKKKKSFRIDDNLLEKAEEKAKSENRSFSNYIETVIKRDLDNKKGDKKSK